MGILKKIIVAIVGGIIITLISGLLNLTPPGLVGATWYGYPFSWLQWRAIGPQYNPWFITPVSGLVGDIVVWAVVILIILLVVGYMVGSMKGATGTKARKVAKRRKK